jgi:hypothetical protein
VVDGARASFRSGIEKHREVTMARHTRALKSLSLNLDVYSASG